MNKPKKNKCANASKSKEFCFTAKMLKDLLAQGRIKDLRIWDV